MTGRFLPIKGHDVLLRALPLLIRDVPGLHAVMIGGAGFAGEPARRQELEALAAELGIAERVIFPGWVEDLPALIGALDVYVHPATGTDSLPTAVLEAMAAGRPVVASAVGGLPELVEQDRTGLLVPPRDPLALAAALQRLLASPADRQAMGAAARARVLRELSASHFGQQVMDIYDEL
jgi:glycosyltransferase involved in cell wall biosynthesis